MTRKKTVEDKKQQQSLPAPTPAPRKRFRLEKLEERIAPKGHYNPQSKWVGAGNGGGGGASGASSGSFSGSYSVY